MYSLSGEKAHSLTDLLLQLWVVSDNRDQVIEWQVNDHTSDLGSHLFTNLSIDLVIDELSN